MTRPALLLTLALAAPARAADRPNVLLAIADDWGWPHAAAYGDPAVKTPTFDRLAREGVLFANAFCSSPSCTPSRGALLTGQFHWRLEQGANLWSTLPAKFPVYPSLLKAAGYATGHSRKAWGPGQLAPGGRTEDPAGPRFPNLAAFLKARPKGRPFCYWWGSTDPHRPYDPGAGAKAGIDPAKVRLPGCYPDRPELRADVADYLFEVQRFDRELGEALALLTEAGELDNTLVVVTSDHGMPFPRGKSNLYDLGTHVPLAVRWPKGFQGGRTVADFVSLTDLAPTFLDAVGLTPPAEMTGKSLLPLLKGETVPPRDAVAFGKERHVPSQEKGNLGGYPGRALRTSDYLFIRNYATDRWPNGVPDAAIAHINNSFADCDNGPSKNFLIETVADPAVKKAYDLAFAKRPAEELYDLRADPDQLVNVAADPKHAAAKQAMVARLDAVLKATADPRAAGGDAPFDRYPYYGSPLKPADRPPAARPNVVVVVADDQGWGDLSLHGNTNLRTPHLDALARAGARFDRFFVQPVCSPTRAELLTGRYHPRGGVRNVTSGGERLDLDERTVADHFRAAGYATGCFGKWHNGSQYPYHPLGRGFDEYYGFTSGHWGEYFNPPLDHNGRPVRGAGYLADDLTDRAVAFLTAPGKPKFCLLALNTPHSPMQVPDAHWDRFKAAELTLRGTGKEDVPHTRAALAMCENIDHNVGRLVAALDAQNLARDTVLVYLSDNGPNGGRWNGGMKGRKGSTDEGGVRSPLFVRWPGRIAPDTTVTTIAAAIDLLPTLAGLAGVPATGGKPLDGISLAPVLFGEAGRGDRVLVQHWNGRVSARSQRHRLDAAGALYDMIADPGQAKPVTDNPAVAKRLADAAAAWKRDVLAELPAGDDRPFPVGHPAMPATTLPARDGVPHGGVKRSAQAPNCSYFTAWTTPAGRMTWEVEVATAGRYEAVVHYTCPAADVGSAVELTLGGARWAGRVTDAHDPPLRGMEHDRVSRGGESFVKDFRPLALGVVEVPAGRGTLALRATAVPGKTVADVRAVELVLAK